MPTGDHQPDRANGPAPADLDRLDEVRILVTGATGFIGGHVVDLLHRLGAEVHAVHRAAEPSVSFGTPVHWHRADLTDARARWAASGIDSYVVTYDQVCFCPQLEVQVTVVDGVVTDSELRSDVDFGDLPVLTVDDMFDEIARQIDAGAFSIDVDYDNETGHPTGYFFDIEEMMADEEFGITNVTVEPG